MHTVEIKFNLIYPILVAICLLAWLGLYQSMPKSVPASMICNFQDKFETSGAPR